MKEVQKILKGKEKADVIWAQEEYMNQGAFAFAKLHIEAAMRGVGMMKKCEYVGANSVHSFATGCPADYVATKGRWTEKLMERLC